MRNAVMKGKMLRRLLSIVLSVTILIGIMPLTDMKAYAAGLVETVNYSELSMDRVVYSGSVIRNDTSSAKTMQFGDFSYTEGGPESVSIPAGGMITVKTSYTNGNIKSNQGFWKVVYMDSSTCGVVAASDAEVTENTVYNICFDAAGGTPASATLIARRGKLTSLPAEPVREKYIFDGWFTQAEGGTKVTLETVFTSDTTVYAHWTLRHTHSWSYEVNGNTVTAKCSSIEEPCDYFTNGITLSVLASDAFYTGEAYEGASCNSQEMETITGATVEPVKYYKVIENQPDEELSQAPKDVGNYKAKVTVNSGALSYTAEQAFSIKRSEASFEAPVPNTITYNGSKQVLALAGTTNDGIMYYRLGTNGTWSTNIPAAVNAGDYTIYYYILGDDNHNDIGSEENPAGNISVTIKPAPITITAKNASSVYGEDILLQDYVVTVGEIFTQGTIKDDLKISVSTTVKKGDNVGNYINAITVSYDTENKNYKVTTVPGNYEVTRAEMAVEKSGYHGTYDGEAHEISVTPSVISAVVYYSETELEADNFQTMGSTVSPTFTDAGEKTIYYYIVADNYQPSKGSVQVSIEKRTVTVSAVDQVIIAGNQITVDGVFYDGFLNNENQNNQAVETPARVSVTEADVTQPGVYHIEVSDVGTLKTEYDKNYELKKSEETGSLIVVKKQSGNNATSIKLANGSGIVETDTIKEEELPDMWISKFTLDTVKGLLTDAEVEQIVAGKDALIYLKVSDAESTATDSEKASISEKAEGAGTPTIGAWLDLSLYKKVGDALEERITDCENAPIEIAIALPEDLLQKDITKVRTYRVIRIHGGVAEVLPTQVENGVLKFTTDKFSLYAVAYKDSKAKIQVTGVTLNKGEAVLTKASETLQLIATVAPADADNKKVTWASSNSKVATVDANGKVTPVANGTCTITVTTEDGGKAAVCKITVSLKEEAETITKEMTEKNALALNAGLKVSQSGNKIQIAWGKVSGADGYSVYVQYCGKSFTPKSIHDVNSGNTTKLTIKKINGKKLNLKKNYKTYVVAYKLVDGKKVTIGRSLAAHVAGREQPECTNVKAVKVKKSSYTLKVGKTAAIQASTVLVDKDKNSLSDKHTKEFRYATSDKKVATVSGEGKIKAVGKGTCTVYVYARNGYAKKVKVKVM